MATTATSKHRLKLPSARGIFLGAAVVLFVSLCILPIVYMLSLSVTGADDGFTLENYRRLLSEERQRDLLFNSTLLGAGTSLLATLIGMPLGLLLARAHLTARRFWRLMLVAPLVIPPYVLALSWTYLGGTSGIVTHPFGRDLLSEMTYSLAGAVIVLGVSFYPLAMLATEAAARQVDASLEEAALLVAPAGRVWLRITLPVIAPVIVGSALVIFVLALAEFGVPGLLRVRVYTTEVFTAFAAFYDFGAAAALAIPLLALTLLAAIAVKLVIGGRLITSGRNAHVGLQLTIGRRRWLADAVMMLAFLVCVALPLTILLREAGSAQRIAGAISDSQRAIINSLALSALSATLAAVLAVLLGYRRARAKSSSGNLADLIFIVFFAAPGTVVGVGLIGLWNRPGLAGMIYTSPLMIIIACVARFLPVTALLLAASIRQVPISFEEAAAVAGAKWPRSFLRIVIPQIHPGLAAAWVITFVLAFGEIGATVLVAPPGESTLPVRIYTIIANTSSSNIAALALAQSAVALFPIALFGLFPRNRGGAQ